MQQRTAAETRLNHSSLRDNGRFQVASAHWIDEQYRSRLAVVRFAEYKRPAAIQNQGGREGAY